MLESLPKLTLSEFLKLPETKPASEYIEGKVYQKIMPKGKHSTIQIFLASTINTQSIPSKKGYAFGELRCTFGGRSLVPDISVFTWDRIPLDENNEIENTFNLHPNWIIEILSPNQISIRVIDNILFCLDNGTKLGWLIDPQERIILIFRPRMQPITKQDGDLLPVLDFLSDWQVSVRDIFSCLTLDF